MSRKMFNNYQDLAQESEEYNTFMQTKKKNTRRKVKLLMRQADFFPF